MMPRPRPLMAARFGPYDRKGFGGGGPGFGGRASGFERRYGCIIVDQILICFIVIIIIKCDVGIVVGEEEDIVECEVVEMILEGLGGVVVGLGLVVVQGEDYPKVQLATVFT